MKKYLLANIAFFIFFTGKNVAQPYTFSGKVAVNTALTSHRSFFSYVFDRSYMLITNEYAQDPSIRNPDLFISYPYGTRKINLFGPRLGFTITANGNSSDFINPAKVTSMGTFVWDTIFKNIVEARERNNQAFFSAPSKKEFDSVVKKENKFDLATLQVRIIKNEELLQDWKNVSQLSTITKATDIVKGNFIIYNDSLAINDKIVITFRNRRDTSLIQFVFERLGSPLLPFLISFGRDTTSIAYADYIKKTLERKITNKETSDEFYRYWPVQPGAGVLAPILNKDRIFTDTKLSLTFRKPDPDYGDTTLEYILSTGPVRDSLWKTTGHLLFLTNFKPGADYQLLVRYKSAPGNIQAYTFHTQPAWYQTTKYRYIITGVIILALFVLSFLIYRILLQNEKKKTARLRYGLKSIRSQLNPHFIFNALSSIQGLINKNDIAGANHYLTEFSSLLRESLRNNDKELVPLETELRTLETYLKLEQLRFHFQYEIRLDDSIDKHSVEIPALLLQPLIENAVKHGLAVLQEKGTLVITFRKINSDLIVAITDNGNGFLADTENQGLGLKLTKDRILLLNQSFKKQPIQLRIESATNKGTTVHLGFQNWL